MIDTARIPAIIHDTLYIKGAEGIDVLNKTDAFYKSSWDHLTFIITIFVSLIGIFIPIAILILQKYNSDRLRNNLRNHITQEMVSTENRLNLYITDAVEIMKADIKATKNHNLGNLYFVQAAISFDNKKFYDAILDYMAAINKYLIDEINHKNIQIPLENIRASLYSIKLDKVIWEARKIEKDKDTNLFDFLSKLRDKGLGGEIIEIIKEIRQIWEDISKELLNDQTDQK